MNELASLRERYGAVFVYKTQDGFSIPWRPLSIQEHFEFERLIESGAIPFVLVEELIFKRVVLDQQYIKNLSTEKAGTISGLAAAARSLSSPQSIEELTLVLNSFRSRLTGVIHEIVLFILRAFPAYKPEEIYALDYTTLMERMALAEAKLLSQGVIKEPVVFNAPGEQKPEQPVKKKKFDPDKLKQAYEAQGIKTPPDRNKKMEDDEQWRDDSATGVDGRFIVKSTDVQARRATGQDMEDLDLLEYKLQQDAALIYKDYLQKMQAGEKVVIKTDEERIEEAKARMDKAKKEATAPRSKQPSAQKSAPQPVVNKARPRLKK